MKRWLDERPWIWIVLLIALMLAGAAVTVVIAERGKPEIVRAKGEY
jgi:phosphopantetheinyl transferase